MAGYLGKDSMRERAERAFSIEDRSPHVSNEVLLSRNAVGLGNRRPYAKGGNVSTSDKAPKPLSYAGAMLKPSKAKVDLHMSTPPSKGKNRLNIESMKELNRRGKCHGGKTYRKGGHCYDDGGEVTGQAVPIQQQAPAAAPQPQQQQYGPVTPSPTEPQKPYAMGFGPKTPGTALKRGGMAKRAEGGKMDMEKDKVEMRRPMLRKGGDMKKYAAGGAAKLRLGEMSHKGMPLKGSHNPGLSANRLPSLSKSKSTRNILRVH